MTMYTLSQHASDTIRERNIKPEWIERALASPALCLPGEDDPQTEHVFCVIHEYGDRVLRVIYNKTKEPPHIVTAYFDRGMKGKL